MPAQHSARLLSPARVILGVAALILILLVGWVAVRSAGPPPAASAQIEIPPPPTTTFQPDLSPVTRSPLPSRTPSAAAPSRQPSPSPSRRASRLPSHSPSPSPSASRAPVAAPSPTRAPNPLTATVDVRAGWDTGYVATVYVTNPGTAPTPWTVTVTHGGTSGLRNLVTWGATGRQNGTTLTFTGGPLPPGATIRFGYEITNDGGTRRSGPSGCTIVGGGCRVR